MHAKRQKPKAKKRKKEKAQRYSNQAPIKL